MFKSPISKAMLCLTAGLATLPTVASAAWDVQNSGEDVFGNVNVTVTSFGDNGTLLRFECGTGKTPMVAMLIRDSGSDVGMLLGEMILKDGGGSLVKADAMLTGWNEQYKAVVASDEAFLKALAEEMISTSKDIPIGAEVSSIGLQISDTFSPSGSTAAGEAVKAGCFGE